jgi:protease-4
MSDANREQMQELADGMWDVVLDAVSSARGIDKQELNRLADELAIVLPKHALEHKFIDGVKYADQMEELFEEEYGIEDAEYISLSDYASSLVTDPKRASAPKVAIVYANGEVIDGEGSDDNIYGYSLSKTLRKVAEDDDIESVVLRVNSPGGSALASDIIWREMENLKAKKPVIVSMGEMAASGGYYISAPADAIVADRSTLTGSIGVFGMIPSFGKAMEDKLGLSVDGVKTNANSGMGNGFSALSPTQYRAMMQGVDRVYERFTSLVAEGRNLTIERVLEIAEGRVWSGEQAQQIGLVDTCGGLMAAIAIAIDKAELGDNYQIVEVEEEMDGLMAIFNSLNIKVRQAMTSRTELGELYNEYRHLEQMVGKEGIYALCPYIFRF